MDSAANDTTSKRDHHLFGPGPKRILAFDGGGVRGAISVAFLEEMERLLRARKGPDARLGDWFDLVGGTSTGAIIAGGIALGFDTRQLEDFYRNRAQLVFRSTFSRLLWRIPGLRPRFDAHALRTEIERVVGDRTLDTPDLITGFALMAKRVDTGSPWLISNNPRAAYWEAPPGANFISNRNYRLANLVRASTAAPFYFDPEIIEIDAGEPKGLFIDGGVTPYNNPSFMLFLLATLQCYKICWPTGPDKLTIVSIGTGSQRRKLKEQDRSKQPLLLAYFALSSLMDDAQAHTLGLMEWLGQSPTPWTINSEVDAFQNDNLPSGPLFNFVRYDVRLEPEWLAENFSGKLSPRDLDVLRKMDDPTIIHLAFEIGREAARKQVRPEHFGLNP